MYTSMVKLQTMDVIFYEAQRQVQWSFFDTCIYLACTQTGHCIQLSPEDWQHAVCVFMAQEVPVVAAKRFHEPLMN